MSGEHPMDVSLLGADLEPLHAPPAVRALGDVDEKDLLE
jgi:hypothetical protein